MKLLFVNGHLKIGGVEKSLVDLLKSIDYTKHQVDLLLFEGYGDYLSQVPAEVNIILCDMNSTYGSVIKCICQAIRKGDYKSVFMKIVLTLSSKISVKWTTLFKLLKITPNKYDCAIAYRMGMSIDYVAHVVDAKRKFAWWHHGEFDYDNQTIKRWCDNLNKIDKLVCVSEATKKMVTPYFQNVINDIEVVSNMVFVDEVRRKGAEYNPYNNDMRDTILVSVGRMSPEKRMINTVLAMDSLKQKGYTNLKWYLVGDGEEREKIEREIQDRTLQDKIVCVGKQSNPYPYIKNADIFVHPSFVESQGITVLEAFALEIPCVITRTIGTEEFVINGKNALLAEQSVDDLVNKIIYMLEGKREDLFDRQIQKETIEAFSSERIIKKVMTILEE